MLAATAFITEAPLEAEVRNSTGQDNKVSDAIAVLRSRGPRHLTSGLQDWEEHEGLVSHKGKLYISKDTKLHAQIIESCHNALTAGHPGKHGTIELISRYY